MNNKFGSRWSVAALVTALLTAFAGGWAVAGTQVATEINTGLLRAFHSVGQNLFGSAAFGAEVAWPDPGPPNTPVRLYFADNAAIPVEINVFVPPNPVYPPNPVAPCKVYARLVIDQTGVRLAVDPSVVPSRTADLLNTADEAEVATLPYAIPPVAGCSTSTEG